MPSRVVTSSAVAVRRAIAAPMAVARPRGSPAAPPSILQGFRPVPSFPSQSAVADVHCGDRSDTPVRAAQRTGRWLRCGVLRRKAPGASFVLPAGESRARVACVRCPAFGFLAGLRTCAARRQRVCAGRRRGRFVPAPAGSGRGAEGRFCCHPGRLRACRLVSPLRSPFGINKTLSGQGEHLGEGGAGVGG